MTPARWVSQFLMASSTRLIAAPPVRSVGERRERLLPRRQAYHWRQLSVRRAPRDRFGPVPTCIGGTSLYNGTGETVPRTAPGHFRGASLYNLTVSLYVGTALNYFGGVPKYFSGLRRWLG